MKKTLLATLICAAASLFFAYGYLVRVLPSTITHSLMQSFDLTAGGLGILSSLYFYGYVLMQIPAGFCYDKVKARHLLAITLFVCSAATWLFGATPVFWLAMVGRVLMGVTASFAFVGAIIVGSNWFSAKYLGTVSGSIQFIGCVGAIIGQGPVAIIAERYGWHQACNIIAVIGVVCAASLWLIVRDFPKDQQPTSTRKSQPITLAMLGNVFRRPQNWWVALYSFCVWTPIVVFASLWGVPFFHQAFHINHSLAAGYVSIVWAGVGVGGPLLGWWSARIGLRKLPMITAASVGLIASIIVLYGIPHPDILGIIALFLYGAASSAQVMSFAVVSDINPKGVLGSALGFANMAVVTGGIFMQPLVGYILDLCWNGARSASGTPLYSLHDFRFALITIPICFFIGLLTSSFAIKETHCRPTDIQAT